MKTKTSVLTLAALTCMTITSAFAQKSARLQDSPNFEYDIRFTNPECKEYKYEKPLKSNSGEDIVSRPKNVFCTNGDAAANIKRTETPIYKLLEWINDKDTQEVYFTYLSFSNSYVKNALCDAIKKRGVKVTFSMDRTQDTAKGQELVACGATMYLRGHDDGAEPDGLGYAHNKIFMVNPNSKDKVKIVFSSGNMTSGVILHHENWHFITTSAKTYFAQAHLCVFKAMFEEKLSINKAAYVAHMKSCRAQIKAPEESDIRVAFIPGDTVKADAMLLNGVGGKPGVNKAKNISIAAHRFFYSKMISALKARAQKGGVGIRVITDDDTYWVGTTGEQLGDNVAAEYNNIQSLVGKGAQDKYMETNDAGHLLHHNKYLVFDDKAVFAGAGNLTGSAFTTNYENFYYISIPSVVEKFQKQYEHAWQDLATAPEDMPKAHAYPIME